MKPTDLSTNIVDIMYLDYNLYNVCKGYHDTVYLYLVENIKKGDGNIYRENKTKNDLLEDSSLNEGNINSKDDIMKEDNINLKDDSDINRNIDPLNDNIIDSSNDNIIDPLNNNSINQLNDNIIDSKNDNNINSLNDRKNDNSINQLNDNIIDSSNDNIINPSHNNINPLNNNNINPLNNNIIDPSHNNTLNILNIQYNKIIIKLIFDKLQNIKYDTQLLNKIMYIKILQILSSTSSIDRVNKYFRDVYKKYKIKYKQFVSYKSVLEYCERMYKSFDVPYLYKECSKLV
ncbi:hypothetical protein NAPIS_ORF02489 [Vairimorpha apis BRL 01]|uniref:Uncharacterized protein n=1 Tax=Vairimorpha apis BRL 01 TaxID=1037528 RepID=T0M9B4_9MICR|nr:hypothetical protein NAPIS_ORF02489 [Vairimorpha apis BRL 01]